MQDNNTVRLLALLVFISSSVAAFCLGAMAFTFVTGSLPFGFDSVLEAKAKAADRNIAVQRESQKGPAQDAKGSTIRLDEEFLSSFAKELEKEREKLAEEKASIEQQRKSAEQTKTDAMAMQAKVEATEKHVEDLLQKVDKGERQNVADMTKLIAGLVGTDPATATTLLLSMEPTLAARILSGMNKKQASVMITTALNGKKPEDKAKADAMKGLVLKMQTLSDELKGDSAK